MESDKNKPDETKKQAVLFAQLVEILTQNAIMMLGAMPDRSGRQRPPDLNAAEMMIEMLAVLQKKTKGNLIPEEEKMLAGTLFQLQTAFTEIASKSGNFDKARRASEAVQEMEEEMEENEPEPAPSQPSRPPSASVPPPSASVAPAESKVKYSKKYN